MINELHIYPTSRALRTVSEASKEQEGFLPTLMRMDEFEQRAILIADKIQIDPLQRILLLREAARFDAFERLNINRDLVRFFSRSDAIFKFFEELAAENVNFQTLAEADAYVEFEEHLAVLEQLLKNYRHLLGKKGFSDKAFIPETFTLNTGFIESYEKIEIYLEGYLSHFELALIADIAERTEVRVHYTSSKFNQKMQERFAWYGVRLPNDHHCTFSLTQQKILSQTQNKADIHAKVYAVEEREEQIALAFEKIEEMVNSGLDPEQIVLILPNEDFKEHFTLFDQHNNLNFAMGYDYSNGRVYKSLEAIYTYWQTYDSKERFILERYGIDLEKIDKINVSLSVNVETFFTTVEELKLLDIPLEGKEKYNEHVYETYLHFLKIFENEMLSTKEWLFLWLKALSKITIDDVRGGLITVMGVLETRGVSFEGVVIVDFNEGVVPASSSKDQFLNSSVRAFANLPTKNDREALQKQYYKRLLEQASQSVIVYSTSDNKLPSKFLYELGLEEAVQTSVSHALLYAQESQFVEEKDPVVKVFDAFALEWSASRLKSWLDCKRKYYYRYIQKIQAKQDDELNEGLFLHSLLDHLYREKNAYESQEEIVKKIDMLLSELLPKEDAGIAYKKLLWKEKLKGFAAEELKHFRNGWKVVEREKEFKGKIGGLRFKGRIDRIDQNDTQTLVIDYKSGSIADANKTKNLESLSDLQMSIYHGILGPKYQNISLAFMKILEKGEKEEITALEEKNKLLESHIIDLKQTTSFIARKCEDLKKCKYCEFALMCERGEYL
jgi:inactivated superfamily I helicase/RecB family exonuclease